MRRASVAALSLLLLGAPARALELSLEENKAQRGNIGYVDLQRVFRLFPETHKAKQSFQEIVRQAEEQVNLRRADILLARVEMSRRELELELYKKSPVLPGPQATPALPPAATAQTLADVIPPPTDAPEPSTTTPSLELLPGMAGKEPLAGSNPPAPAPTHASPTARDAGLAAREAGIRELEERLGAARKELARKEAELRAYQDQVEKNLLDIEGRRTEILLGKIYDVLREVARENGVSVVVDKGQILFGQKSVDLTDKVVKKLEQLSP